MDNKELKKNTPLVSGNYEASNNSSAQQNGAYAGSAPQGGSVGNGQAASTYGAGNSQAASTYGAGNSQAASTYGAGNGQAASTYGAGKSQAASTFEAYRDRKVPRVLKSQVNWEDLHFYQKSDVLYQLTFVFCSRFLPAHGDRTVDQMVQAARSGKQNIVEGSADGTASTEMELKLLNVARASIHELREDFRDFLIARQLTIWEPGHPRYRKMIDFCKPHNKLADYEPYFERWSSEEMANIGLTLCHMIDAMMHTYMKGKEAQFVKEGGIKERMYAARTGYRKGMDERLAALERENVALKAENAAKQAKIAELEDELRKLKQ